ncbi:hypothetical protein CBR_g26116 [Chara braunii]|uniref:Reverse transcriptase domain-containing protein n=1 Tax=Chara braunii TaxID=69332 RepID=A0A388JW16_CHABU|nr:hypothetical protein CBR_g26116 [Chara braunii]|eukprot:GBG61953.1 hypothetical protein CBR_g26116 [Chara braunii]
MLGNAMCSTTSSGGGSTGSCIMLPRCAGPTSAGAQLFPNSVVVARGRSVMTLLHASMIAAHWSSPSVAQRRLSLIAPGCHPARRAARLESGPTAAAAAASTAAAMAVLPHSWGGAACSYLWPRRCLSAGRSLLSASLEASHRLGEATRLHRKGLVFRCCPGLLTPTTIPTQGNSTDAQRRLRCIRAAVVALPLVAMSAAASKHAHTALMHVTQMAMTAAAVVCTAYLSPYADGIAGRDRREENQVFTPAMSQVQEVSKDRFMVGYTQSVVLPVTSENCSNSCWSTVLTIREKARGIPITFDSDGEVRHSLNFYIFPDLPFDLVFSMQWLRAFNPRIDWQIPKVELPNGQGVYQTCRIATEHHPKTSCYCLRAREFYSLLRQYDHERLFLALVKQTDAAPVSCPPEIQQVVDQYADPMQEPFGLPNRPTKHHIELLPGAVPPKGRIYRMSLAELEELRSQLETLTSKGWIRSSTSEFGAPVLFVSKGNGEFRMCIDNRGLNKITRKSTEPLPRIDDLLAMVQGCTVFSKVDLKYGYHQIEMAEEDVYKITFKPRYGIYEFLVMPFGLCNALGTFQTEMHRIFRPYLDKFMVVYLDDILVFNRTTRERAEHLALVLQSLRDS